MKKKNFMPIYCIPTLLISTDYQKKICFFAVEYLSSSNICAHFKLVPDRKYSMLPHYHMSS